MFQLIVESSPDSAEVYTLDRPNILLGSLKTNDIVIRHATVAGEHARLTQTEEGLFRIHDLTGGSGLRVNGVPVRSVTLESGDRLEIGVVRARLQEEAGPDSSEGVALIDPAQLAETDQALRQRDAEILQLSEQLTQVSRQNDELSGYYSQLQAAYQDLESEAKLRQREFEAQLKGARAEVDAASTRLEESEARAAQLRVELEMKKRYIDEQDQGAKKRIQRNTESVSHLRKITAQQENEIREMRQELIKLRQAKDASDTLLDSFRKNYMRDKRQHTRLVEQYRERALQESMRADSALHDLARAKATSGGAGHRNGNGHAPSHAPSHDDGGDSN